MGTVIKFGFDESIKNPNLYKKQFKKLSAPSISINEHYKIPVVYVKMDHDIKYGNNNFITVFDNNYDETRSLVYSRRNYNLLSLLSFNKKTILFKYNKKRRKKANYYIIIKLFEMNR